MKTTKLHKRLKNESGFTLIELIMVIAILGVLAAVGLPIFADLVGEAETAAGEGIAGAVKSGIAVTYSDNILDPSTNVTFPLTLDGVANGNTCDTATPCFTNVLQYPADDGSWTKTTATSWTHASGLVCTYTAGTGAFTCQ